MRPELARELEPPILHLHSATWTADDRYELAPDATRFELWESDVAARLGLGAAVHYLLALGVEEVEAASAAVSELISA